MIRVLVVEDNPADYELLLRELRQGGLAVTTRCVDSRDEFVRVLDEMAPDIVISDFVLPAFDGLSALAISHQRRPDLPFIFVSGTIGEETAVAALKKGATDYVMKGQTKRLCRAVERAVNEGREREERRRLEEQLVQAQKMEAIGQLAGGIAHDFNNLLTAMLGFAELAHTRVPEGHPVLDDIRQIQRAGERAADLTRQLLAFSKKQMITPQVVDLNASVRAVERMLQRVIGEHIRLRPVLAEGLGRVRVDPSQVEQIILNLAINARDAMPHGGEITIETGDVVLDENYTRSHGGIDPGPYVMLAVSDTGEGMSTETMAHLFEPFFTTKGKGRGTGLGLATVYGIVKQNGGSIWVYSELKRGTTFKVYFPRVKDAVSAPAAQPPRPAPAGGGSETILVVEDDAVVRRLIAHVLRHRGYGVLEATDGREALVVSSKHEGRLDLVLTDVVMPEMGGSDLAKLLSEKRPALKILFLSGYTSDVVVHQGMLEKGRAFIQKPFTSEALSSKVRAMLDG